MEKGREMKGERDRDRDRRDVMMRKSDTVHREKIGRDRDVLPNDLLDDYPAA